jgi:hypothetical protein
MRMLDRFFCLVGIVLAAYASTAFPKDVNSDDVQSKVDVLATKVNIERIDEGVAKHDASVLAVIPSKGFKDGVSGVFKKFNLYITSNASAWCRTDMKMGPGCEIEIYFSRKRASGQYSDLAGFHAIWFRGIDDKTFKPINGGASRLTITDNFLQLGGPIDTQDRP